MKDAKFSFERFTDVNKSFSARVTIRRNGQLGFNEGAKNQFGIGEWTHAVLFFDNEKRAVGLMLTNDAKEAGAIKITNTKQNTFIPAKAFLDRYGVSYVESQRYCLEKHHEMLVFELDEPLRADAK